MGPADQHLEVLEVAHLRVGRVVEFGEEVLNGPLLDAHHRVGLTRARLQGAGGEVGRK